ncbi:MAG: hypothetical protein COA60_006025 [Robiginitomaculum sp.]|nr:hypothetical protein [Robiginitomaculum sp.]MBL1431052.1 hypothetical protein [Robiginitomaculum sp.]
MAESLSSSSLLIAAIGQVTEIDMKPLWQPDEAFFEILRDKRVVNAMVADIAGESVADSVLTDTGKVQKNIITNRIAPQGHFQEGACHGVDAPNPDCGQDGWAFLQAVIWKMGAVSLLLQAKPYR